MHYINVVFFTVCIILLLTNYLSKYAILLDAPSDQVRKIHKVSLINFGGIAFFTMYFVYGLITDTLLNNILICSFIMLATGLLADLKIINSYSNRFYIILLITIFFVVENNFIIKNYDHEFLNYILKSNFIIPYIFSILGLIFLVNGINFIDGIDGLAIGTSIIIITSFIIQIYQHADSELMILLYCFLIVAILLFYFNFFQKNIFIGDSGAYFCGFFIGCISIYLANKNLIPATFIACIIFYPFIELFISFWRRLLSRKNPFKPDFLHLHSLLYKYLELRRQDFRFVSKINCNTLSSTIILSSLVLINILLLYFSEFIGYLNSFILLSAIYLVAYFKLRAKLSKYN